MFYKSLRIRDSLELTSGVISSKIHLSEYFAFKKDTFKAFQFSRQALTLSRTSNKFVNTLEALKQIAIVDPKNASLYSKEYIKLNDKMVKCRTKNGRKVFSY